MCYNLVKPQAVVTRHGTQSTPEMCSRTLPTAGQVGKDLFTHDSTAGAAADQGLLFYIYQNVRLSFPYSLALTSYKVRFCCLSAFNLQYPSLGMNSFPSCSPQKWRSLTDNSLQTGAGCLHCDLHKGLLWMQILGFMSTLT